MRSHIAAIVVVASSALAAAAQQAVTTRVSVTSAGAQAQNNYSGLPAISGDGRYVAFSSRDEGLVPGDSNAVQDIFVHDTQTGATTRVSVDSLGAQGDQWSYSSTISDDGRYVVFGSRATNLVAGDTNAVGDCFVHDRQTAATERVSVSTAGVEGDASSHFGKLSVTADGRYVLFASFSTNLVANDTNGACDVFLRDRTLAKTYRVSVDSSGAEGQFDSYAGGMSADARFVVFETKSVFSANDINATNDIYVLDRQGGVTTLASVNTSGIVGNGWSEFASISANGRVIAFDSLATNLVASDTNGTYDIFVRDLTNGVTSRVSVSSAGAQGMGESRVASISADGRYVVFESWAVNLAPGDVNLPYGNDTFLHDRFTHTTVYTDVASSGVHANYGAAGAAVSADGRRIVFHSGSSNLVPGDTNNFTDVFLREILCGAPADYCEAGLSTNFCSPAMSASGVASASAVSGFVLTCTGLEAQKTGLILYGASGRLAQPWGPIGGSLLCVAHPTQRTPTSDSGGTLGFCDGSISIDWLTFLGGHPNAVGQPISAGMIVDAQCWYRDPPAPKGTNLSNAIEFELCP